ncbi:hypothetical protein CDAR_263811 [Caerostris darwini]|uniref:Uncharacterized protein n=1 Tax=Caerostris darwini TaxID=1538125 RepID=A0AAV4QXJ3_9ARAC|nr:hypothetical protein CDAR_38401 [Caerostris darwini]GIY18480.1 hypothetical protein CDAR_263811 [Caerostris darwini]
MSQKGDSSRIIIPGFRVSFSKRKHCPIPPAKPLIAAFCSWLLNNASPAWTTALCITAFHLPLKSSRIFRRPFTVIVISTASAVMPLA